MPLIQQFMQNANPEAIESVLTKAKQLGAPDSVLAQLQNIK